MVPAGNKTKRLSSVNHTTKTIHHHHHHHYHYSIYVTDLRAAVVGGWLVFLGMVEIPRRHCMKNAYVNLP